MSVTAWRIVERRHLADAFTGEGARRYGGRWNSPGVAVVYAASSRSLAMLELLVHLRDERVLPAFVMFPVGFEEAAVRTVERRGLPRRWDASPPGPASQRVGDRWVASASSVVLSVPSVVVPGEQNFLINPAHADLGKIKIGSAEPVRFDPRLLGPRRDIR